MKMQYTNGSLMINAEGVPLGEPLIEDIRRNAMNVFRRYPRLLGMKIDLKLENAKQSYRNHVARVRLILPGHDKLVEKSGEDLRSLVGRTFDVADRQLRRRAREWRARRR